MICYQCGSEAGSEKFCPKCGADLEVMQRVRRISNSLYNDAYYKAQVRDLSGAIVSLQNSLKYNKYNTQARNLLGLVYYEIGESVNALSEWVISVSLQPEDNVAVRYLKIIKETRGLMERMDQTSRKYNQAVYYCTQNNTDLAIVQLKNVISVNPNMLKAHQLLALLYLKNGQLEKARNELKIAGKIDSANTTTFRYMKEVNRIIRLRAGKPEPKEEEELVTYQNGNETIIMPKRFKESSLGSTIAAMIVGLVIGTAAAAWIITPTAVEKAKYEMQEIIVTVSESVSMDKQRVSTLESRIEAMQSELDEGAEAQANIDGTIANYQTMMESCIAYYTDKRIVAAEKLWTVDSASLEGNAADLYKAMYKDLYEEYLRYLLEQGEATFDKKQYAKSIDYLTTLVQTEADYDEGNAAYMLAMAYRKNKNPEKAEEYFRFVIRHHSDTDLAKQAEKMLESMQEEETEETESSEKDEQKKAGQAQ